ncbi:TnsA-like heteromeric transposase endonuclease subunit [Streptomyces sp. NPDC093982]|uniref:TnsA-like heteromeric transposase endonuclease subunit n=1 Tax=Streptomyces sp. NPDC093982 TaxID=3155077 RepID=UPI00343C275A
MAKQYAQPERLAAGCAAPATGRSRPVRLRGPVRADWGAPCRCSLCPLPDGLMGRLFGVQGTGTGRDRAGVGSVDVVFYEAGRESSCLRWSNAATEVAFERCPPLRPFPARTGKRLAPGWWWSSTTGRLVHYASAAMRLHVMLLDRDPRVSGLAARPLELRWREPGRVRAHTPQLMLRLADGQGVLADCTARGEHTA